MNLELLKRINKPDFSLTIRADKGKGYCHACGQESTFDYEEVINDNLAKLWQIDNKTRHAFSSRESRKCKNCLSIYRNRLFSRVLCEYYGNPDIKNLEDLVNSKDFQRIKLAEINSCGPLHKFLAKHPNLKYSEFDSDDPDIKSENLHNLTYKDRSFDLVLTSDTLEHVPDYTKALSEIYRVLKPNGRHIFTIPIIWQRKTIRRAEFNNLKKIQYVVEPAYHGPTADANLVWTDFGRDVLKNIDSAGFLTKIVHYNLLNSHDAGCVLVSTKLK
jgi:SAM-dependent methyltransferase